MRNTILLKAQGMKEGLKKLRKKFTDATKHSSLLLQRVEIFHLRLGDNGRFNCSLCFFPFAFAAWLFQQCLNKKKMKFVELNNNNNNKKNKMENYHAYPLKLFLFRCFKCLVHQFFVCFLGERKKNRINIGSAAQNVFIILSCLLISYLWIGKTEWTERVRSRDT